MIERTAPTEVGPSRSAAAVIEWSMALEVNLRSGEYIGSGYTDSVWCSYDQGSNLCSAVYSGGTLGKSFGPSTSVSGSIKMGVMILPNCMVIVSMSS